MVSLGFIGSLILLTIICIATYNTYHIIRRREISKPLIALNFIIWISNFFACLNWTFFRTNIFHTISASSCIIIYISNYLCFMLAKYAIHILLLYRLYLAVNAPSTYLYIFRISTLKTTSSSEYFYASYFGDI